MLKIKFLRINLPEGLEKTYQYLVDSPFARDGQSGFEVISFAKNQIEAKFIEQTITKEQITDPFGDIQEIIAIRYMTTELKISDFNGTYILSLRNPSRSVNTLIKRLSILTGTSFYATLITTDIEEFGMYASRYYSSHPIISTKVFASNITLDDHSTANIELLSSSNAILDLKIHFPSQEVIIERARFSLVDHGKKSQLEIRSTGIVGITGSKRKLLEEIVTNFISSLYY
ncbi:hypothetical protein ACTACD_28385 [Pseudomonas syringae]|uniref:hypothetical protein n=1 Tax=Pseudomonas syringae TaxID=317 RepID=UPI003F75F37F